MKARNRLFLLLLPVILIWGCQQRSIQPQQLSNPAQHSAKYPYLFGSGENLYMSWISTRDTTTKLKFARYSNGSWSTPSVIAESSGWFVNWADYPSIIGTQEPIAAHWLNKIPGGKYAYNINISTANEAGEWQGPFIPHKDGTATEHGFVSMIPWDSNTILAVWLDGRDTAYRKADEYYDISKAMTLRGALISTDGTIRQTFLIDDAVCDCCSTSLVKTDNGAVIAYRNRTDEEIRDIYVSQFDGTAWSKPRAAHKDGWKVGACPVNGPTLASADSTVVLAWHTESNENSLAKVAISEDRGTTFGKPVVLNNAPSLGRVGAALYNDRAFISWMENRSDNQNSANLQLSSFRVGDTTSINTKTIATLNKSRKTGFPQMEVAGDELIFAWTAVDSVSTAIKTKRMKLQE